MYYATGAAPTRQEVVDALRNMGRSASTTPMAIMRAAPKLEQQVTAAIERQGGPISPSYTKYLLIGGAALAAGLLIWKMRK